jgi:hypothetical protein
MTALGKCTCLPGPGCTTRSDRIAGAILRVFGFVG